MASDIRRLTIGLAAVSLVALGSSSASAQYINSEKGGGGGDGIEGDSQGPFEKQSLTVGRGDITVMTGPLANPKFGSFDEAGLHMYRVPGAGEGDGETPMYLQTGLAFGAAPGLELGVFTPAMGIKPHFTRGDLPVFIAWATRGAGLDVGLRSTLTVPTDIESIWRWNPGTHVLGRFDGGRVDLGLFFPMQFISDDDTNVGFNMPVRASMNVSNDMYLGLETGIRKLALDGSNDLFIPLGFHALYSLGAGKHRVDIGAKFHWDGFFWAGAPDGVDDRILQDFYSISLGANVQFDIGAGRWPMEAK